MSKRKLYHGTRYSNLGSILADGLRISVEGGVYLTDSDQSAFRWTAMRTGGEPVIVCEVEVDEENLIPGADHSPMMQEIFGCGESLIHLGPIPASQITNYLKFNVK